MLSRSCVVVWAERQIGLPVPVTVLPIVGEIVLDLGDQGALRPPAAEPVPQAREAREQQAK